MNAFNQLFAALSLIVISLFPVSTFAQYATNSSSSPVLPKAPISAINSAPDEMPKPYDYDVKESEPLVLNYQEVCKSITYPEVASDAGIQGRVHVRVLVDRSGKYMSHIMSKTANPMLEEAVEPHLAKLKFTPAQQDGQTIPAWTSLHFTFKNLR